MKKILLIAACAGLVFASCSKDAVSEGIQNTNTEGEQTPVTFGVYSNVTRAAALDADGVKDAGIGLFAFEQDQAYISQYSKSNWEPNFMYNQKLDWNTTISGAWGYSPVKYWPNTPGAKVSFFAYAPYNQDLQEDEHIQTPETNAYLNEVTPTDNGLRLMLAYDLNGPGIEYNMPSDPTKGVDLMWGALKNSSPAVCPADLKKSDYTTTSKVELQMKHALSRLAFTIQVINDVVDVNASGDAIGSGDANKPLAADTKINIKRVSLVGNFASKGTLRLYDGKWCVENGNNQTLEFKAGAGQFAAPIEAGLASGDAIAEIPLLKSTNAGDNYVMAIPGAKFYIEIEYDVVTTDQTNIKNSSTVTNVISTLATGGGTVDPSVTDGKFLLEPGTAYLFNLKIGMTSVKFDVDLSEDWNDPATTYQVDLPKNYN